MFMQLFFSKVKPSNSKNIDKHAADSSKAVCLVRKSIFRERNIILFLIITNEPSLYPMDQPDMTPWT